MGELQVSDLNKSWALKVHLTGQAFIFHALVEFQFISKLEAIFERWFFCLSKMPLACPNLLFLESFTTFASQADFGLQKAWFSFCLDSRDMTVLLAPDAGMPLLFLETY